MNEVTNANDELQHVKYFLFKHSQDMEMKRFQSTAFQICMYYFFCLFNNNLFYDEIFD